MRGLLGGAILFVAFGCTSKPDQPEKLSSPKVKATASSGPGPQASQPEAARAAPSPSVLPTWPALPAATKPATVPAVASYKRSKEPTLVVFFGTWCGGCVASVLADADLAKRFSPKVRVGLALMADTDEKFREFARGLRVPLVIDVWRDEAATRELKELCDIHGLPMSCLVDADHKMLWRGEPGNAAKILTALEQGNLSAAVAAGEKTTKLVEEAVDSKDAALRARALSAAAGLGGFENTVAWDLVVKAKELDFAAALARDATVVTGGLDVASLDTYAFALWKLGHREAALTAAKRGVDVCDALATSCSEERGRYEEFKASAGKQ